MRSRILAPVIVALAVAGIPSTAQAGLPGTTLSSVQGVMASTAKTCETKFGGYTQCTSTYGPVTSTCTETSAMGTWSACALTMGDAAVRCESEEYASSRGGLSSQGCSIVVSGSEAGCAEETTTPPTGSTSTTRRVFWCTVPGLPNRIGVPLDPALP